MRPVTGGGPPRYQEIMAAISDDISSGRVAVGTRLPTEQELCAQHNAGRHTIREAIRGLVEAGMVERRPRLGTRVISAEPVGGYRWLPVSAADIAANVNATWIVRGPRHRRARPTRRSPDGWAATSATGGSASPGPGSCATAAPANRCASANSTCPTRRAPARPSPPRRLSPGDLADQVIEQEIRADLLDDEQATALHADRGSAALVVVRRHRRPDGRLVAIGIHTHPSDRFSITMTLLPGTNGGPPGGQQSR